MLFEAIKPGTSESYALRDWIEARLDEHHKALAAPGIDERTADLHRGRILELRALTRELDPPEVITE